jgi:hypothetical protein
VHEGGFRVVRRTDGHLDWFHPDGRPLEIAPAAPRRAADDGCLPALTLELLLSTHAVEGHVSTPLPSGERLDVGWRIDVLRGHEPIGLSNR